MRPRIGEAPPVDTAITSGLRSTIEGMMKSESFGRSATLTSVPALLAAARVRSIRPSSSVAMKQSDALARSSGAGSRGAWRRFGLPASSRNSSLSVGANTVTRAPARTSNSARRAATTPAPITAAARSRMSRKIGRSRIDVIRRMRRSARRRCGLRPPRRPLEIARPVAAGVRTRRSARPRASPACPEGG